MKIAELIIRDARDRGLTHYFGIPGGGAPLDLLEEGRRQGVEFISVAHESSAALMAGYHGTMKGTAGLSLAVKGIGAGNLVGGAVNAFFERLPVVCICESSPTFVRQEHMVQKTDHDSMFGPVVKFRSTLAAESAAGMLRQAVNAATSERPGPALLNVPSDLGGAECGGLAPHERRSAPGRAPAEMLAPFAALLRKARKPVVLAGADVVRAGALTELREFVEHIEASVLVTMDARGVFPESHRRWAGVLMGMYGPNIIETEMMAGADLIVHVGVDSMMSHTPWKSVQPVIELAENASYESLAPAPVMRVNGELKASLMALLDVKQAGFTTEEIAGTRKKVLRHFERPRSARLAAQDVISAVRECLPAGGALFTETGAFVCMLEHLWPVDRPGDYYGTSGGRTMGLMLPAILGAKLGQPGRPMIGLGADGSLLMRLGELEVFARAKVALPLVIINDRALGTMKSRQKSRGLTDYGLDLADVDFAKVASAFGLNGVTVTRPEDLRPAIRAAFDAGRTTLIDARVDPDAYQDSFGPTIGVF